MMPGGIKAMALRLPDGFLVKQQGRKQKTFGMVFSRP